MSSHNKVPARERFSFSFLASNLAPALLYFPPAVIPPPSRFLGYVRMEDDEESTLSSLLDELDSVRASGALDLEDDENMDETIDAPPPPQGVRKFFFGGGKFISSGIPCCFRDEIGHLFVLIIWASRRPPRKGWERFHF